MKDLSIEHSKLIGTYYGTGQRIKVVTKLGEQIGVINFYGGSSTSSGRGGINNWFTIKHENGDISDDVSLDLVLSINVV